MLHAPKSRHRLKRRANAAGPGNRGPVMERVTGIEPAPSAWEAETLPLSYTRDAAAADQRNGSELVDVRGNA
jgi:hypothetical protein